MNRLLTILVSPALALGNYYIISPSSNKFPNLLIAANRVVSMGRICYDHVKGCLKCPILQVWKVRSGQCLRKYERAHTEGVTSACFSRDGSHILSASYDGLARIHGIKSGKMLKEFRGHTSYVNSAIYSPDGSQVFAAASTLFIASLLKLFYIANRACKSVCLSLLKFQLT